MEKFEGDKSAANNSEAGGQLNRNRSFKTKQLVRSQAIRESHSPPRTLSPNPPRTAIDNVKTAAVSNVITNNEADSATTITTSHTLTATTNVAKCHVTTSIPYSNKGSNLQNIANIAPVRVNSVESSRLTAPAAIEKTNFVTDSSNVDKVVTSDVISSGDKSSDRTLIKNSSESSSHLSVVRSDSGVGDCTNAGQQRVEIQITSGHCDSVPFVEPRGSSHQSLLSFSPRVTCVCLQNNSRGRRRRPDCPPKQDSGIACPDDCLDCCDEYRGTGACDMFKKSGSADLDPDSESCRYNERNEKPKNLLTRTDSDEKTELSTPDLIIFIKNTLNRNIRDRVTMFKIEKELIQLVTDPGRSLVKFPAMTSYGRMLVHRCASLFQLSHHLDPSNKMCVRVSKSGTSGGCVPCTSFKQWCDGSTLSPVSHHMQAKSILKRDAHSLDETNGGAANATARSKSLEQREKEYERVRRRIFSTDSCSQDELQWPWLTGPVRLLTAEGGGGGRNRLLKVQSLEGGSSDGGSWRARGPVSKSHSFGGYGGEEPPPHRVLSRHGDLAASSWRVSPSSSGYKTLSVRSTDSVTPSPTGGVSPEPGATPSLAGHCRDSNPATLLWAVTDVSAVPPGALIIHPDSGRPFTNPDGSLYHYDPSNPPVIEGASVQLTLEQSDQNNEKRRGRLEKQHSFIDNECICQPPEEMTSKSCCCQCVANTQENEAAGVFCKDIPPQVTQNKPVETPISPLRTRYESPPTNRSPATKTAANHVHSYDATTSQTEETSNQQQAVSSETNQNLEACSYPIKQTFQGYETSALQLASVNYVQTDVQQAESLKTTSAPPMECPRSLSLSGMVYPAGLPPAGYYTRQCGMEQPQLYQQVLTEDPKQLAQPQHHSEPTFRIDASYPYNALDPYAYPSCVAACSVDQPLPLQATTQRSYGVTCAQAMEQTVLPGGYPINNVLIPQHLPQYAVNPYQQLQWQASLQPTLTPTIQSNCATPIQKPPTPPNMYIQPDISIPYPQLYNQGQVYPVLPYASYYPGCVIPQMIQQPYVCPVYPVERPEFQRRGSFRKGSQPNSARTTPFDGRNEEEKVPYDDDNKKMARQFSYQDSRKPTFQRSNSARSESSLSRQNSNELALRIQQVKEQIAAMNTDSARARGTPHEERARRNDGLLGSCPANHWNVNLPANDDLQLNSAARAIVNSLRSMQPKSTYHQDNRRSQDYQTHHQNYNQNYRHQNYQQRHENYQGNRSRHQYAQPVERGGQSETAKPANQSESSLEQPMERQQTRLDQGMSGRRPLNPVATVFRPPYMLRQMSPGPWVRRSPAPVHPNMNAPRRPPPDASRNYRRYN